MPMVAVSCGDMAWNRTGAWRAQRPFYEDKTPPCSAACPAGNDIVGFIQKVAEEDFEGAFRILTEENPFPGVCGRVCFHPCETKCNRGSFDEPIAIHALERFVAEVASLSGRPVERVGEKKKEKVAIVGSGPAGMSCAYHLARLGYDVTVFESFSKAGGLLRMAIPSYRLPRDVLDRELSRIEALGVQIRTGVHMGQDLSFEDLKEYQATFIATGAHRARELQIQGEKGRGVLRGLDFLRRLSQKRKVALGERIAVIGGGNTAVDVARSLVRLGKRATILYRRSREEMPAFEEEVLEALEEGVKIRYLVQPVRIGDKDGLKRIECLRMELGEPDESGRRRPVPVPHSTVRIDVDQVIVATGEEIEASFLPEGLERREGIVLTRRDGSTGIRGVFAGGDLTSNQRTVAHAIGSGKRAAMAIDAFLSGRDPEKVIEGHLIGGGPSVSISRYLHPGERPRNPHVVSFEELNLDYFEPARRQKEAKRSVSDRIKGFEEITSTLPKGAALEEAERCFNCGTCNGCEICYVFCPDLSILKSAGTISRQIDYDYCKGCGICFTECPRGAISLKEEAK
ncbi:MAG: NAD(P)-binding protein [Desulfobacterota bacterium]|nr:NAD(P)-binding protein [Thermodesulfobacteriota bacterium]